MTIQQANPEMTPQGPDISLKYDLIVSGDPASPVYDLKGQDAKSDQHLKKDSNPKKPPNIDFPYGVEWYVVSFKLKDGGMKLRFNATQPVDAHDASSCPAQFSGIKTDQFKQVCASASEVSIVNGNQVAGDVGYGLNLVDSNGKSIPQFDPIFQNAGGGRAGFM